MYDFNSCYSGKTANKGFKEKKKFQKLKENELAWYGLWAGFSVPTPKGFYDF